MPRALRDCRQSFAKIREDDDGECEIGVRCKACSMRESCRRITTSESTPIVSPFSTIITLA